MTTDAEQDEAGVVLKLYVAGSSARSERARRNLEAIRDRRAGSFSIEVIDILQDPQVAEDERIIATPALVREVPPPARRVIGDLSDSQRVLSGLDLLEEGTW